MLIAYHLFLNGWPNSLCHYIGLSLADGKKVTHKTISALIRDDDSIVSPLLKQEALSLSNGNQSKVARSVVFR
jgi:hypothetical protein